jgi:hypothetical protein
VGKEWESGGVCGEREKERGVMKEEERGFALLSFALSSLAMTSKGKSKGTAPSAWLEALLA